MVKSTLAMSAASPGTELIVVGTFQPSSSGNFSCSKSILTQALFALPSVGEPKAKNKLP